MRLYPQARLGQGICREGADALLPSAALLLPLQISRLQAAPPPPGHLPLSLNPTPAFLLARLPARPPVQPPILIRRALGDDVLPPGLNGDPNGYPIGAGADLFISLWNLHR